MPGWQITLITVGAALIPDPAALRLDLGTNARRNAITASD
jgi:hypothetical protein